MTDESHQPQAPAIAARLGKTRVELRPDLDVSRHVFRGKPCYILQDPLTFQSHRFSIEDYRVLTSLSSDQDLCDTFLLLVRMGLLGEADEERFYRFVYSLHKKSLLKLPISDDGTLYKRHVARKRQKQKAAAKSVLFWRIPVWNPNRFLNRTMGAMRPFFSRTAFIVWALVVGTGSLMIFQNWSEFMAPTGDIFSGPNLPLLWITLIVLKVAHEFGHAYACKHYGGHVPEMGVFLIVFTPCAYVCLLYTSPSPRDS